MVYFTCLFMCKSLIRMFIDVRVQISCLCVYKGLVGLFVFFIAVKERACLCLCRGVVQLFVWKSKFTFLYNSLVCLCEFIIRLLFYVCTGVSSLFVIQGVVQLAGCVCLCFYCVYQGGCSCMRMYIHLCMCLCNEMIYVGIAIIKTETRNMF